jgi:hypothetical protein
LHPDIPRGIYESDSIMTTEAEFTPRTDDEIVARIRELMADQFKDFFGFESSDLIATLPLDVARQFLKAPEEGDDEIAEEDWEQHPRDREGVLADMLDYMPFAWDKVNNCRGLSAGRSMSHYSAWSWLIREDFGDLTDYEFYGKPNLIKICEHFGWDHTQWDDGVRTNTDT